MSELRSLFSSARTWFENCILLAENGEIGKHVLCELQIGWVQPRFPGARKAYRPPAGASSRAQIAYRDGAPKLRAGARPRQSRRVVPPGRRPRAICVASQHFRI